MPNSRRLAALIGPIAIVIAVTEWLNADLWRAANSGLSYAPFVYLNGTLLFIAGLAIVRAHNYWTRAWPVLVTLTGWLAMLAGLGRMIAPVGAQEVGRGAVALYGSLVVVLLMGILLTIQGYRRGGD